MKTKLALIAILTLGSLLRLNHLGTNPPGLFGDEVDAGYNAYSILKTGYDYNGNFLPIHFESYGDYRTPLYLYSIVPFIPVFGLTPFAVRFPAALFGILGIFSTYLLVKKLTLERPDLSDVQKAQPFSTINSLPFIAALLLAITPWHIHYSRAAFEVTLMYFLLTLAVYFFLKSLSPPRGLDTSKNHNKSSSPEVESLKSIPDQSNISLTLSAILFALAPYSYNTAKLFTPLLILILVIVFRKPLSHLPKKTLLFSFFVLILISTPLIYDSILGTGQNRFSSINITNDQVIVPEINRQRGQHSDYQSTLVKLHHHKPLSWLTSFTHNYLTSFSPQFLFFSQTDNARHVVENSPQIYYWMLPFLFYGLYQATQNLKKNTGYQLALFWLLVAPIPAALTLNGGNHPTRLFIMIFPLIFLTALGIHHPLTIILNSFQNLQRNHPHWFASPIILYTLYTILLAPITLELILYLDNYYTHYPLDSYQAWQVGFNQAINYAKNHQDQYEQVIITKSYGPPLLHFLFYTQFPPAQFHQIQNNIGKQGNLSPTPEHIDKFWFTTIAPGDVTKPKNTLYLAAPWDRTQGWSQLDAITLPDSTELFKILSSN